jgi:hypothetical protein
MSDSERAQRMGCSAELVDGIRHYQARIARLGGYGAKIRARMPNGSTIEGELIELGSGGCQPGIASQGKRYRVQLDSVEAA